MRLDDSAIVPQLTGDDRNLDLFLEANSHLQNDIHTPHAFNMYRQSPPWNAAQVTGLHESSPCSGATSMNCSQEPTNQLPVEDLSFSFEDNEPDPDLFSEQVDHIAGSNKGSLARNVKASDDHIDYRCSTTMSRTHSLAHSECMGWTFSEPRDDVSSGDYRAGITLDGMEGVDLEKDSTSSLTGMIEMSPHDPCISDGFEVDDTTAFIGRRAFIGSLFQQGRPHTYEAQYDRLARSVGTTSHTGQSHNGFVGSLFNSDRHEVGVPGSFPTTGHHYPPRYDLAIGKDAVAHSSPREIKRPMMGRGVIHSPLSMSQSLHTRSCVSRPRQRCNTVSSTKQETAKMNSILEDLEGTKVNKPLMAIGTSQQSQLFYMPQKRAKRSQPLPDEKRHKAAVMRRNGSTCLPCKVKKVAVRTISNKFTGAY